MDKIILESPVYVIQIRYLRTTHYAKILTQGRHLVNFGFLETYFNTSESHKTDIKIVVVYSQITLHTKLFFNRSRIKRRVL